jgi:hypothetical protein
MTPYFPESEKISIPIGKKSYAEGINIYANGIVAISRVMDDCRLASAFASRYPVQVRISF